MALSDLIEFRIEFGLGSFAGTGVYGTSEYGVGTYGGSGGGGIQWTDMTQLVQGFTTKTGKNLTQPVLKRFRTGTAIFTMDNTNGVFVPGSPTIPGFLQLRPGRYVRILAIPADSQATSTPIPDGQTWTGTTGRTWEAHGDGLTLEKPAGIWEPIWMGRIDTIDNQHDGADLTAIVRCTDAFAELAVNDQVAEVEQGAGETASQRITRILDHAGWPEDRRDIAPGGYTMQATTLAQDALSLAQITTDSAGGSFWSKPDGDLAWRGQDWMHTDVDWVFGGITGLPVSSVTPEWSVFNVVNEALFAAAGSTVQRIVDGASQTLYGRRTHRRLDLVNDTDADVASLAALVVNSLKDDRMYLEEASVLVQDDATAEFVTGISIGDLLQITVETVWGWANTYQAWCISISDDVTPQGWIMTLGLQDAQQLNQYGPFSRSEFNEAFHLGGPADA